MLLGDVGGLSGLLFIVGTNIVSFLTYNNPENRLVERLFLVSKAEAGKKIKFDASKQYAFMEFLQDFLPLCCS